MYRTETVTDKKTTPWFVARSDHPDDIFCFAERVIWAKGGNSDYPGSDTDGWSNSESLKEAIHLGRFGWDKGRQLMKEAIAEADLVRRSLPRKTDTIDVAGSFPIVPIAVAGDPVCMVTQGFDLLKARPVLRVLVNVACSGGVNHKTIIRRGGAIVSWIDELESSGVRCDVEIVETGLFRLGEGKMAGVVFSATGKLSHEPVDIDKLGFLLCHPSVQRRIFFALYEREEALNQIGISQLKAITYGIPTDDVPEGALGEHSIYFPAMLRTNEDYESPALAVAAVERAIMKSLQLTEESRAEWTT